MHFQQTKLNIMAKTSSRTASKSSGTKKTAAKKSTRASSNGTARKSPARPSKENTQEELTKLFEHALKDMYWVEKTLTKSLPKMIKKAKSQELINALKEHLKVTEGQVTKLERVFSALDKKPQGKKCVGMDGILKEGEELMGEFKGSALDAAIIAAGQKVEHYEISSYNGMITLARTLDMPKEADLLQQVLNEEMESDKILANIAIKETHKMLAGTSM